MTSIDSDFGLRKNPFSTQGSDTNKTDFVPTKAFKELTDKINQVRHQKNSRAIIVQGPQGSGKTATKKGLDQQYSAQSDVGIIQVTLSSLDLRDLTWSIVSNAKEQNLIDDAFLTEIGYEESKDIEKPKLEKIIVKVLEEVVSKNELCILIIDEFDVISQPTFHDTNDQTLFLHNITNVLNLINESEIIQKRFCLSVITILLGP